MKSVLFISLILLTSCISRQADYSDVQIETFKKNIMNNKDINSYEDYSLYVINGEAPCDILPYALRMKDVYPDAYYNLFYAFLKIDNKGEYSIHNLLKLQKPEQDLLVHYLEEGARKESSLCLGVLIELYKNEIYFEKNTKKLDSLEFVADSLSKDFVENPKFE
ncbi:hypothetical protein [Flavobacterium eburneipallidum]|uniref:hypothetical protein n=1 Tax=Flavobacterium eburneipallidum TaxID=3003263 RepID=UPI0022AC0371|nr:hypothetical protein [Flavobacterium eburneipallidum]